jgi:anti-anti-sigma factor
MDIKVSRNGDNVYLLKLFGIMDISASTELKDLVMKIIRNKIERLIIDLNGVGSVDSSGIGALLNISSTL